MGSRIEVMVVDPKDKSRSTQYFVFEPLPNGKVLKSFPGDAFGHGAVQVTYALTNV